MSAQRQGCNQNLTHDDRGRPVPDEAPLEDAPEPQPERHERDIADAGAV